MTVAFSAVGTVGIGSTSVTPGTPSPSDGDGVLIHVMTKPDTATINTPAGWTLISDVAGGGGTNGNGTGPTRQAVFWREKDASWSAMPAISITNGNASAAIASRWTKDSSKTWVTPAGVTAAYGTAAATTNGAATLSSDPGLTAGDAVAVGYSNQDEAPTWSAQGVTATGATFANITERSEAIETTTGNDMGGMLFTADVSAGTATAAPQTAATLSAAGRGTVTLVRLREQSVPLSTPLGHIAFSASSQTDDHTTSAFTPRANSTIYAWLFNYGFPPPTTTISDSAGRTWTLIDTFYDGTEARGYLWSAPAGASPGSTTITFTDNASSWRGYVVWDVDANLTIKSGSQKSMSTQASASPTTTGSMPAAATSGNLVVAMLTQNDDNASGVPNPTGFTNLIASSGGYFATRAAYRTDFTSAAVTVTQDEALSSGGAVIELVAAGSGLSRDVADSAPATDSLARQLATARALGDTAAATDAIGHTGTRARALGDTAAGSDSLSYTITRAFERAVNDSAPATDASTNVGTRTRAIGDSAPAADTLSRAGSSSRALGDTAAATDTLTRSQTLQRALSDSASATDTTDASTTGQLSRSIGDSAPAVDSTSKTGSRARSIGDTAAATDATVRAVSRSRAISDSAPATDSLSSSTTHNLTRAVGDTATVSDATAANGTRARAVGDSAPATDASSRSSQLSRLLGDTASASDLTARALAQARALLDTAAAADVLTYTFLSGEAPIHVDVVASLAPRAVHASLRSRRATGTLIPRDVTAGVRT